MYTRESQDLTEKNTSMPSVMSSPPEYQDVEMANNRAVTTVADEVCSIACPKHRSMSTEANIPLTEEEA